MGRSSFLPRSKSALPQPDVNYAGAAGVGDLFPLDHLVVSNSRCGCLQPVEGTGILPAHHVRAGDLGQHLGLAQPLGLGLEYAGASLRQIVNIIALTDLEVSKLWVNGRRHVCGQRPRSGGPHQQMFARPVLKGKSNVNGPVGDRFVAFFSFLFRDSGAAARAPRHGVEPLVDQPALMAALEEAPNRVVVLVRHRVVRVWPVTPHAQADRLPRLNIGVLVNTLLTSGDEVLDPVLLDVPLGGEAQVSLHLDLHPEPLAIETLLPAQVVAGHGEKTLEDVLVGPAPGVVDAHEAVGGYWTVEERPSWFAPGFGAQLLKCVLLVPELENGLFARDQTRPAWYLFEQDRIFP